MCVKVTLEEDSEKENPPVFVFKVLSARQTQNIIKLMDVLAIDSTRGETALKKSLEALRTGLVEIENLTDSTGQPVSLADASLEDLLTIYEIQELIVKMVNWIPPRKTKTTALPQPA